MRMIIHEQFSHVGALIFSYKHDIKPCDLIKSVLTHYKPHDLKVYSYLKN